MEERLKINDNIKTAMMISVVLYGPPENFV